MKKNVSTTTVIAAIGAVVALVAGAGWLFLSRNNSQYIEPKPGSRSGIPNRFQGLQSPRAGGQ